MYIICRRPPSNWLINFKGISPPSYRSSQIRKNSTATITASSTHCHKMLSCFFCLHTQHLTCILIIKLIIIINSLFTKFFTQLKSSGYKFCMIFTANVRFSCKSMRLDLHQFNADGTVSSGYGAGGLWLCSVCTITVNCMVG